VKLQCWESDAVAALAFRRRTIPRTRRGRAPVQRDSCARRARRSRLRRHGDRPDRARSASRRAFPSATNAIAGRGRRRTCVYARVRAPRRAGAGRLLSCSDRCGSRHSFGDASLVSPQVLGSGEMRCTGQRGGETCLADGDGAGVHAAVVAAITLCCLVAAVGDDVRIWSQRLRSRRRLSGRWSPEAGAWPKCGHWRARGARESSSDRRPAVSAVLYREAMPGKADVRSYGSVFNDVAGDYDRHRPSYPDQLIDRVCEAAGLRAGAAVLEIGCGTGQLTRSLLARGLQVTAVEPGQQLIARARDQLDGLGEVQFVNARLEDAVLPRAHYSAVFSASAIHWIDPDVSWRKAADALVDGASVALVSYFWARRSPQRRRSAGAACRHRNDRARARGRLAYLSGS
jgi:Methyltransferase domain